MAQDPQRKSWWPFDELMTFVIICLSAAGGLMVYLISRATP